MGIPKSADGFSDSSEYSPKGYDGPKITVTPRVRATQDTYPEQTQTQSILDRQQNRREFLRYASLLAGGAATLYALDKFLPEVDEGEDNTAIRSINNNHRQEVPTAVPEDSGEIDIYQELYRSHESVADYNAYIEEVESRKGWAPRNGNDDFGEDFINQRNELRPNNHERTVGFIISDKVVNELEASGINAFEALQVHVNELNSMYEAAGIDLRYTLTGVDVFPDSLIGPARDVGDIHRQKLGMNLPGGLAKYPRYQDSTWVFDFPYQTNKAISEEIITRNFYKEFFHEIIHHTGVGDFYKNIRNFNPSNSYPFIGYSPDDAGYMGRNYNKISAWEKIIIEELMKNGKFSPQHDGDTVSDVFNPQEQRWMHYSQSLYCSNFAFQVKNNYGDSMVNVIDGMYTSNGNEDRDSLGFDVLQGVIGFSVQGNTIQLNDLVSLDQHYRDRNYVQPSMFALKSNTQQGVFLPFDLNLMLAANIAKGKPDVTQIEVVMNSDLPDLKASHSIGLDVVEYSAPIVYERLDGRKVYAYSNLNEKYRAIWYLKPLTP